MAIKYLSAEKKAKKKRNRIIITVISVILIVTVIVLYLIFNTDFFRTKRGAFIRYLQTTNDSLETIKIIRDKNLIEAKKNKQFLVNGEMKINSSANIADSNILDKLRLYVVTKGDYQNDKINTDISVNNGGDELAKLSLIKDSDYYGMYSADISNGFIGIQNDKVGAILADADLVNAGTFLSDFIKGTKFDLTSNLASSIVDFNTDDVLEESKLQKKYFQNYFKMLKNVSDTAYTKKQDDKIVIDGVTHNVNTYTLSLNERESADLIKSLVDKLTQDSLTMDFITTKLRMLNLSEEYTDINTLNRRLKQFATEYQLNPSRYGKLSISVSEEKQSNIQTSISFGKNSIIINHLKDDNNEMSIFKINDSSIKLQKVGNKVIIALHTINEDRIERGILITREASGSVEDNNLEYLYISRSVIGIKNIELNYNEKFTFGNNIGEINGFKNTENLVILNEFNKDQISEFVKKLESKINEVYISKSSSIGISVDPIFTF